MRSHNSWLAWMNATCKAVGVGCLAATIASWSQLIASLASLPRKRRSSILFFCSHSNARTSMRVWAFTYSRSVFSVSTKEANAWLKSLSSLKNSQLCLPNAGRTRDISNPSRYTIGNNRLLFSTAWSISWPHTLDAIESGLMTKINVSAPSIPALISSHQSAVRGIFSQSTQASYLLLARAWFSTCTKALSLRE